MIKFAAKAIDKFEKHFPKIIPYIWGLSSATALSISLFLVKRVSKDVHSSQVLFFRAIQQTIYCFVLINMTNMESYFTSSQVNRLLIYRGITGTISIACSYVGVSMMLLSDATVLMQVYPVITGIFAYLILGEKYELTQLSAALICLVGVIFIAQPQFIFGFTGAGANTDGRLTGTLILLASGVTAALAEVLIKKAGSKTNPGITTLYFGIIGTIFGAVYGLGHEFVALSWTQALYLFWIGILSFTHQMCKNRAFILGNAGRVSNTAYFGIVNGYLLDIFILGTQPSLYSILGAMCILSCMFIYIYQISTLR